MGILEIPGIVKISDIHDVRCIPYILVILDIFGISILRTIDTLCIPDILSVSDILCNPNILGESDILCILDFLEPDFPMNLLCGLLIQSLTMQCLPI